MWVIDLLGVLGEVARVGGQVKEEKMGKAFLFMAENQLR